MKKKVVFIIESLHLGGAEKSLVTLLQNLDYSLHEIDLITFQNGGIFRKFVPHEVNQIQLKMPKLSLWNRFLFLIKRKINRAKYHNAQILWQIIGDRFENYNTPYDIAIAYNQGFSTYYTADYIIAQKKYAWLNTDYQKAGYNITFDHGFYQKYRKIIAVSREVKEGFLRVFQINNLPLETDLDDIRDITDKTIIEKQAAESPKFSYKKDKINIVSVGRLVKPKGFDLAIDACEILKNNGHEINWYVIGEGADRLFLENLIKAKNLVNHFFLLGAHDNPYPYMKNCDIYVQTSLFEGLGLTVIEASYLCKPIVCTNFPTAFGIISDEETGLIAKMEAKDIANKIERLILDKTLKEKFITNLSQKENLDKEKTLEKINTLLV